MPPPKLVPNRENDTNLMERFIQYGYSKAHLSSLNRCRMYLKALWLSDITTVDGKNITKTSYQGKYQPNYKSTYTWPTIQRPKPTKWTAWRTALRQCFNLQMPTMLLPNQLTPLKWNSHITKSHFIWWYDPDNDTVYQRQSNQYMKK